MVPNHIIISLKGLPGTYALLAAKPEIGIVFVHGFFGDAHDTWIDFQRLVDKVKKSSSFWSKCDLYFYRYASDDQIVPQGKALISFLRRLVSSSLLPKSGHLSSVLPGGFRIESDFRPGRRKYRHLILVGHSTGAVIIRDVVLQELAFVQEKLVGRGKPRRLPVSRELKSLILDASVRFFAPAHLGAICSGKLAVALNAPISETLLLMLLRSKPLFHNIEQSSPILRHIESETAKMQKRFPKISALTAHSLFGSKDAIVNIGQYAHEPRADTEQGQSHTSVCKPNASYMKPLEFIFDAEP